MRCWICRAAVRRISGDSFALLDLPGGRQAAILSDGMGAGEDACRESTMVIELLEELLEAGFPEKSAIRMLNAALVMGREEIHYSTVDMTIFDLYTGMCKIVKAGASSTFIKKGGQVEHLSSSSLPIGVVNRIEIDAATRQLDDGDCWMRCRWGNRISCWKRSSAGRICAIRKNWPIMCWNRCWHGRGKNRRMI